MGNELIIRAKEDYKSWEYRELYDMFKDYVYDLEEHEQLELYNTYQEYSEDHDYIYENDSFTINEFIESPYIALANIGNYSVGDEYFTYYPINSFNDIPMHYILENLFNEILRAYGTNEKSPYNIDLEGILL